MKKLLTGLAILASMSSFALDELSQKFESALANSDTSVSLEYKYRVQARKINQVMIAAGFLESDFKINYSSLEANEAGGYYYIPMTNNGICRINKQMSQTQGSFQGTHSVPGYEFTTLKCISLNTNEVYFDQSVAL